MDRVYTTRSVSLLERANPHSRRNGNVIGAGAARMHGRGVEGDHDSNQTKLAKVIERTSMRQCSYTPSRRQSPRPLSCA